MKKKLISVLLVTAMLTMMFTGCGKKTPGTDGTKEPGTTGTVTPGTDGTGTTDTGYKGDLEIMHFSTSEESQGNGGSDGFRTVLADWQSNHKDINLVQTVLANTDYKTQIATLAGANDLPDVFLLQGMNTKSWAEQGLIMDMSQIIADSPYADRYNDSLFYPFTADGKIYGLPVLTGGTCAVVVYDEAKWKDAGFDKFPETWDDVIKAKDYFKGKKTDPIAFGNGSKWQANSCFLSTVGDRFTGSDWTHSLIEKTGASFTDKEFVDALKFTQDIFASGVFNADFNAITNEDAREYYIAGDAAAFIGGNWDVSYIQATLAESDKTLYDNTRFAVIPQPAGAKGSYKSHNIGLGYAVAINPKLANDPAKLKAAIDLAYEVTGPAYAEYVGSKYALAGLTKVENIDLSKFDRFTTDFYNYQYVDNKPCEIYDSYITGAVWDILNTDLQAMLNGAITPEKVAENAKKAYDANY